MGTYIKQLEPFYLHRYLQVTAKNHTHMPNSSKSLETPNDMLTGLQKQHCKDHNRDNSSFFLAMYSWVNKLFIPMPAAKKVFNFKWKH